jgi:hypothetical protein
MQADGADKAKSLPQRGPQEAQEGNNGTTADYADIAD